MLCFVVCGIYVRQAIGKAEKSPLHNSDHFSKFQNNPHAVWHSRNTNFVNFSFYPCTPPSCACVLVVFIPSHSLSFILTLHHADGGVGNSSLSYTPSSACAISFHSSSHHISVTNSFICIKFPAPQNHEHLVCFGLLVTTFSFPCSLHMPLITTFLCSFLVCTCH